MCDGGDKADAQTEVPVVICVRSERSSLCRTGVRMFLDDALAACPLAPVVTLCVNGERIAGFVRTAETG